MGAGAGVQEQLRELAALGSRVQHGPTAGEGRGRVGALLDQPLDQLRVSARTRFQIGETPSLRYLRRPMNRGFDAQDFGNAAGDAVATMERAARAGSAPPTIRLPQAR